MEYQGKTIPLRINSRLQNKKFIKKILDKLNIDNMDFKDSENFNLFIQEI